MLRLTARPRQLCDGLSRRAFFRVGGTAAVGLQLGLADVLRAATGRGRAKSLILFALEGGPSHIDLFAAR